MCLLGRKESSNEAEANYDQPGGILRDGQPADDLFARNLHALLDADPKHPNAEKRQQQLTTALKSNGDGNFIGNDDGGAKGPGNLSGIMHAARGGWKTFDLACGLITTNEDESSSISLSNVLGLSTELEQFDDTRTQLWVQLLAQAVLGGDVLVLKKMYLMIGGGPGNTSKRNQSVLARCDMPLAEESCQGDGNGRGLVGWMDRLMYSVSVSYKGYPTSLILCVFFTLSSIFMASADRVKGCRVVGYPC